MGTPENGTEVQPFVTTLGRKSGKPHPVQIRAYYWSGRLVGTSPFPKTRRDWVLNILDHPNVTIQTETQVVHATAKVMDTESDSEIKENVSKHRIEWRSVDCPVFEPQIDAFVEFFPDIPVEELFDEESVVHSPGEDPLPASTLSELIRWQAENGCYPKQIPEEKTRVPGSPVPPAR